VQPGQNLFRIALRYNTTINAIARLNGITNTRLIRVGQRLRVVTCARGSGSAPYYGAHYIVRAGDTLFRIAVRYGVSVSRLKAANGLRSNLIVPGQNLAIP
jgi:LysM repeat protein